MSFTRDLAQAASERYRTGGPVAYHFARGKLSRDPVFEAILARGLLTHRARILDLGCGQGLLAAWLLAARSAAASRAWPAQWAAPPHPLSIRGIEQVRRCVDVARAALGCDAEFIEGDVRRADFARADGIVILDVLHYIEYAEQVRILVRTHAALAAGGVLLLRVGDACAGLGFKFGKWVDQMVLLLKGNGWKPLHCRSLAQWCDLLESTGFACTTVPMSTGTPFANVLIVATPR